MQTINLQTVETLKAQGHYFAAGALDAALGLGGNYGCHYGMKSERPHAFAEYMRGWRGARNSAEGLAE